MKSNFKSVSLSILITAIIGFLVNYLLLPAWNLQSTGFWSYFIFLLIVFTILLFMFDDLTDVEPKLPVVISIIVLVLVVLMIILGFFGSKLIQSKSYGSMIEKYVIEDSFEAYEASINNVPLLDKDSAMLIANRRLGGLIDVVSQFEVDDTEQITVKGEPLRVAILQYGGFFKWMNNKETGTPGYIRVDMKSQDSELVRVEGGIKYSHSEYFSRDINRYVRKNYPSIIFENPTLELDEEGHPYWLAPIVDFTIGLFGGKDINGAITIDAVTGETQKYSIDDIPDWVDNVYSSELLMTQYDNYGKYQDGFWNSVFGQRGVKVTTKGYNYIPQDTDNFIYTGVTSTGSDESNIGFVLINKRTKETVYYPISGAEEYSAMSSAEGVVQHLGYKATFPLLLKVENEPTYLVTLKDAGGLVKMISLINVEKYQVVSNGNNIKEAMEKYRELLVENGIKVSDVIELPDEEIIIVEEKETVVVIITIDDIKEYILDGTTHMFIKPLDADIYYEINAKTSPMLALLEIGEEIDIEYNKELDSTKQLIIKGKIK